MALALAIDWSGALAGVRRKLWLAAAEDGELVRLEAGRDRAELVAELVRLGEREPELTAGLDFCFGFPRWFTRELGLHGGEETWRRVARDGERWLAECPAPFFGRGGVRRSEWAVERGLYRATESALPPIGGVTPKSVFQLIGSGQVGTGSLRGMPWLLELARAGWQVWPFGDAGDSARDAGSPRAFEIYPRALTGVVEKRDVNARRLYLAKYHPGLRAEFRALAEESEDAFDAAVSALRMTEHSGALRRLPKPRAIERDEGAIWIPPAVLRPLTRPSLERTHPQAP